jgi:hypothetical protein
MAMKMRHGVIAGLISLALTGTGCLTVADDEGPILSVELYWDEDPRAPSGPDDPNFIGGTCETAGVEVMEWHLLDADGEEVQTNISSARGSAHPCYNAIDILGLPPGTYRLEINGYDDEDNLRWTETSGELNVLRFDVMYAFDIPEP